MFVIFLLLILYVCFSFYLTSLSLSLSHVISFSLSLSFFISWFLSFSLSHALLPSLSHFPPFSQAWRKRWFVLRRGRMSGDPDVLEYFRSKTSRKPIRSIDLQECEVAAEAESGRELEWGAWHVKRHLANQHLFVVKTSTRVFYLLAKTAEEMNCWVRNIGQICTFSTFNHSTGETHTQKHLSTHTHVNP